MHRRFLTLLTLTLLTLAGCVTPANTLDPSGADVARDAPPFLGYAPPDPDDALALVQESILLLGEDDVEIHARIVRPEGDGPFPVIAQFTPYTAPGENAMLNTLVEPAVSVAPVNGGESRFVSEFVRRGYAFAFADVRGTGDSSGCLDLRGAKDVADLWHLTEWLGTQSWSSGKVGFIGASYPGSEAHMAALAGNEHLAAVVPVVASTSYYHYHHNDGVPYFGQHSLGGTNAGYTQNAIMPTVNPQHPNYATRYAGAAAECDYKEVVVDKGGMDQTGTYDDWWAERNLRPGAASVTVPVLMAQGLADWNVKPDHIAHWFNDVQGPKTLIAGQWPHAWPYEAEDAYGDWWTYVTAFFDTFVKGVDTGMFGSNVAWVQDTDENWHRSASWPLLPGEREEIVLHLAGDGALADAPATAEAALAWHACPRHERSFGAYVVADAEEATSACDTDGTVKEIVFESEPFATDVLLSGVPLVDLVVTNTAAFTHYVVVLEVVDASGEVTRENYGYLNPAYRNGVDAATDVPTDAPYAITIDLYPQEDVVHAGEKVRLTVRSTDGGRTIEAFEDGENAVVIGGGNVNTLTLPVRPAALTGTRL